MCARSVWTAIEYSMVHSPRARSAPSRISSESRRGSRMRLKALPAGLWPGACQTAGPKYPGARAARARAAAGVPHAALRHHAALRQDAAAAPLFLDSHRVLDGPLRGRGQHRAGSLLRAGADRGCDSRLRRRICGLAPARLRVQIPRRSRAPPPPARGGISVREFCVPVPVLHLLLPCQSLRKKDRQMYCVGLPSKVRRVLSTKGPRIWSVDGPNLGWDTFGTRLRATWIARFRSTDG